MRWHRLSLAVIGVWLIASPWVLGYASVNLAFWNSVFAGALVLILSFSPAVSPGTRHAGVDEE